ARTGAPQWLRVVALSRLPLTRMPPPRGIALRHAVRHALRYGPRGPGWRCGLAGHWPWRGTEHIPLRRIGRGIDYPRRISGRGPPLARRLRGDPGQAPTPTAARALAPWGMLVTHDEIPVPN